MSRASAASAKGYFIIIAMVAALAGLLFGYDTGVISGAILFIRNDFQLTPITNGMVVSSVLFGALIGALFSGRMTDYYGRKMILIVVALLFILGNKKTDGMESVVLKNYSTGCDHRYWSSGVATSNGY
jgi:major inositol transporter-like SP family MFS transporter